MKAQTKEAAIAILKACEGYEDIELTEDESGTLCGTHANGLPVRIVGTDDAGWFEVHGGICKIWLDKGGAAGELGLPFSNEERDSDYRDPNGKCSRFQHGTIHGWPTDPNNPNGEWSFEVDRHPHITSLAHSRKKRWELPPEAAELRRTILSKLGEIDRIASQMLPSEGGIEEEWKESEKEVRKIRTEIKPYLDAFDSSAFFIVTFGMLKAGKSTLVNALVGHPDVSPVGHGRETTKRSSIIFAADAEHPEGIYIYKPKGNRGNMSEDDWHKELCESLILALGGVGKIEDKFDLDGDKPQSFSKDAIEKLLTKKPPSQDTLPPVIRVSPKKAENLLDDGVAILDTPGLDGLEANKTTDLFWRVLPSQGDFFLLVQSSMSGLNESAANDVKSIYEATHRAPGILIVYNKIVSEFWLNDGEKTKKLEKDEEEVENYLRNRLHDVSKGAEVDIVSVNAGAACAALFGNSNEFTQEFSKNPAALLEQSQIEDLSRKLRGMLQRSRMQIKIDRLKGRMEKLLDERKKEIESKRDAIPKLKKDDLRKSHDARKKAKDAMDRLLAAFADPGKSTSILKTVADAAVDTFTKTVSDTVIEDAVKIENPSGTDNLSRDACREAVKKIVEKANEDCCRGIGGTIVSGSAILQTEPWSRFSIGKELEEALDIVMGYLHGTNEKESRTKDFLASLFYKIDASSLKAELSYSAADAAADADSNLPQPILAGLKLLSWEITDDYVRRKDWNSYAPQLKTRLTRHFIPKSGNCSASQKLRDFVIEKMKAAGKEQAEELQKRIDAKIGKETDLENDWQTKNEHVHESMIRVLNLENEIYKAISEK